jgi:Glycosyltransferase family 9 (heptosyltransferase)
MYKLQLAPTFSWVKRPALFFANGIGDHFLALPTIRAICSLWPGLVTLYCARYGINELWEALPLHKIVEIEMKSVQEKRDFDVDKLTTCLLDNDLFISLVPWMNDSLHAVLQKHTGLVSIGFHQAFTHAIKLDYTKHSSELYFDTVRICASGGSVQSFAEAPNFPEYATRCAADIIDLLPEGCQLMVVHFETLVEKMWPAENVSTFIETWLQTHPYFYVFCVGSQIPFRQDAVGHERFLQVPRTHFLTAAALVARALIFLGVDSSFLHVADLCNIPSVGLFGPTARHEFGLRFCRHINLKSQSGHMSELTVEQVVASIEDLLSSPVLSQVPG